MKNATDAYWDGIEEQALREGVVCFLQNAWSPVYAGGTWPRRSWLRALRDSRSGKRLRLLVSNPAWCHNTTPIVGGTASSVVKPDLEHMKTILASRSPKIVIACGKQAEKALAGLWGGPLIVVPHPAHRLLTNVLYEKARICLDSQLKGEACRVAFRQREGSIEETAA